MHWRTSRAAFALLLAIGLWATGCDVKSFRVRLKSFGATAIEGLWVWQHSPATGKYVRYQKIAFGPIYASGGQEFLSYTFKNGATTVGVQTVVERPAASSDTVTLQLAFQAPGSGSFKLSSFNEVGESGLSTGTLVR